MKLYLATEKKIAKKRTDASFFEIKTYSHTSRNFLSTIKEVLQIEVNIFYSHVFCHSI